jgi:hypothetical protein
MNAAPTDRLHLRAQSDVARLDGDMTELRLLLPEQQLRALERVAHGQGLSTGELLRRVLAAFLHEPA